MIKPFAITTQLLLGRWKLGPREWDTFIRLQASGELGPPEFPLSSGLPPSGLNLVVAIIARRLPTEALQPLLGDNRHHEQRGDGIGPPPTQGGV